MIQKVFAVGTRTKQAAAMNSVVIGEHATKMSKDHSGFIAQHPSIPWASMKAFAIALLAVITTLIWRNCLRDKPKLHLA